MGIKGDKESFLKFHSKANPGKANDQLFQKNKKPQCEAIWGLFWAHIGQYFENQNIQDTRFEQDDN